VKQLIEEAILLRVPPERDEGEVILVGGLIVLLEDDIVDIKLVKILEELLIWEGICV
jgi:hypothetical protein